MNCIDIGGGHSYVFIQAFDASAYERVFEVQDEKDVIGILERHYAKGGVPCRGMLHFTRQKKQVKGEEEPMVWTVADLDPLTLDPSIKCTACGAHGWIRKGHWIPAPDDRSVTPPEVL